MNRHGSIKIPLFLTIVFAALIAFELTSTLTFAEYEGVTSGESTTQQEQTGESKSLDELREEVINALNEARDAQNTEITESNEDAIKDKIYVAESAVQAYVDNGGNEEDFSTDSLATLSNTYQTYTSNRAANSASVTVGDVNNFLSVNFPKSSDGTLGCFASALKQALADYYSYDPTDTNAVVYNTEAVIAAD